MSYIGDKKLYLTGFADEASQDRKTQIEVTKTLGWNAIEARNSGGTNIHDRSEEEFQKASQMLDEAGIHINCFGSAICTGPEMSMMTGT